MVGDKRRSVGPRSTRTENGMHISGKPRELACYKETRPVLGRSAPQEGLAEEPLLSEVRAPRAPSPQAQILMTFNISLGPCASLADAQSTYTVSKK